MPLEILVVGQLFIGLYLNGEALFKDYLHEIRAIAGVILRNCYFVESRCPGLTWTG